MVTVGINERDGTITIAGKSAHQPPEEEILVDSVVAIKIKSIEEATELVTQLLYTIRKQGYDEGFNEGLKIKKGG